MPLDAITFDANGAATPHGSVAMRLLQSGFNPLALRTLAVLRKEEWIQFDQKLIEIARQRLRGVADLMGAGLTFPLSNGMGTTVVQWEQVSDMDPAIRSMDGLRRTQDDRVEFNLNSLPIYITHKDFSLNLRHLEASRRLGESIDTTQIATATRLVSDDLENALFNGTGNYTVLSDTVHGYTTHPNRNTYELTVDWDTATGEQMIADILAMINIAHSDNMFGPYWLYVPTSYGVQLDDDFKTNSDRTRRERLLAIDSISAIRTADFLAADNIMLVQPTSDVIDMVTGMQPTVVEWEEEGGFKLNFKVMAIMVPRIKNDYEGRSGLVHGSTASGGG